MPCAVAYPGWRFYVWLVLMLPFFVARKIVFEVIGREV